MMFSQTNCGRAGLLAPCQHRVQRVQRRLAPRAAAELPPLGPQEDPSATFPLNQGWSWQRASPKKSLVDIKQDGSATPFALNAIEAIHWASFPLGWLVSGLIIARGGVVLTHLGGDLWRLYVLSLGLLCQVFGGGIAGNMMHTYEGWQVAPFRSPLALPAAVKAAGTDVAAIKAAVEQAYVANYNDAWLRSVAYQFLFSFQSFGIALFSLAVFGWHGGTLASKAALAVTAFTLIVSRLGPQPRTAVQRYPFPNPLAPPVSPLSWWLLGSLIATFSVACFGYVDLFGASVAAAWPPSGPLAHWVAGGAAAGILLRTPLWGAYGAAAGAVLWALCGATTLFHRVAVVTGVSVAGAVAATLKASVSGSKPAGICDFVVAILKATLAGVSLGLFLFEPWASFAPPSIWPSWPCLLAATWPTAPAAITGAATLALLRKLGELPLPAVATAAVGAGLGAVLANATLGWLALLAPLCVAAGGIYEGFVAEATFDQWHHWRAFVILMTGLALHGLLYLILLPL